MKFTTGVLLGLIMALTSCISGVTDPPHSSTAPATIVHVHGETLSLSADPPDSWRSGTRLREIQTLGPGRGTTAPGALDPASVVVRRNGQILAQGSDYLLDELWGVLGDGPSAAASPDDQVSVDYAYSLLRIDSLVAGRAAPIPGPDHLTTPLPPELAPGQVRTHNIFVNYHNQAGEYELLPIVADAAQAPTQTTRGGLPPRTRELIRSGRPVKIVCWGDSVTAGGDASTPENRYPAVFRRLLADAFPAADIDLAVVAVGGSNSRQWLYPEQFPRPGCDFQRILDEQPDLVTLLFVNDAYLTDQELFDAVYHDIRARVAAAGAELLIVTPHFTRGMPRDRDNRPYVRMLKAFAAENHIPLADASARWEHLHREGIPYITLLRNAFNHPDDRGHRIFAEELIKVFTPH